MELFSTGPFLLISLVYFLYKRYNSAMAEVLQANVFFLITAIAVTVFTVFLCVAMYLVIRILRSVRNITERIELGSETIVEDVKQLRNYVAGGSLISQIMGLFVRTRRSRKRGQDEVDS